MHEHSLHVRNKQKTAHHHDNLGPLLGLLYIHVLHITRSILSVSPFTVSDEFCDSFPTTLDASQRYVAVSNGLVFTIVRELCEDSLLAEFEIKYLLLLTRGMKLVPFSLDHCKLGAGNPEPLQKMMAS